MPSVIDENTQFTDETTGELINNGYIYIGTQNLDAKLNTITIYSDRALTTVIANPQRTGPDGRSVNKIWITGKYSIKVEDSANVQKLNNLDRGESTQVGNTILNNALGVNDVTVTGSPTITTLVDGQTYIFTAPATNTGAMTLKIDGTAVIPLKKLHDVDLVSGDVEGNQQIAVIRNEGDNTYELLSNVASDINLLDRTLNEAVSGIYDFTSGLNVEGKSVIGLTPVTNWDGTSNLHIRDDATTAVGFDIDAVITTWESIGPTGSSATNIWTELDDMPSTAKGVMLRIFNSVKGATNTNEYRSRVYGRKTGTSIAALVSSTISIAELTNTSGSTESDVSMDTVFVAVDSSGRFDLEYSITGTSPTVSVLAYFAGWLE